MMMVYYNKRNQLDVKLTNTNFISIPITLSSQLFLFRFAKH